MVFLVGDSGGLSLAALPFDLGGEVGRVGTSAGLIFIWGLNELSFGFLLNIDVAYGVLVMHNGHYSKP